MTEVMQAMTAQIVFDRSVAHLATMRRICAGQSTSYNDAIGVGRYRDGKDCFPVGIFITDEEYAPACGIDVHFANGELYCTYANFDDIWDVELEITPAIDMLNDLHLLPERLAGHIRLLGSLQRAHDNTDMWQDGGHGPVDPTYAIEEMSAIAAQYRLDTTCIKAAFPPAA